MALQHLFFVFSFFLSTSCFLENGLPAGIKSRKSQSGNCSKVLQDLTEKLCGVPELMKTDAIRC